MQGGAHKCGLQHIFGIFVVTGDESGEAEEPLGDEIEQWSKRGDPAAGQLVGTHLEADIEKSAVVRSHTVIDAACGTSCL